MMICSLSADAVAITYFLIFICLMKSVQCVYRIIIFITYIDSIIFCPNL